jgi:hypothetical protein
VRPALVSPRVRGAVLAASWTATERVLWLAAVDRCLRATAADSVEVQSTYRVLRALIDWVAPSLYAQTPVDAARESRWIVALRDAVPEGTPGARASAVVWASAGAWTDGSHGRWGALADAALDLGDALDAGEAGTLRSAEALRATMAEMWEMEAGR